MGTRFETGKTYSTWDGDLITVVSRKRNRIRYADKFGKQHVVSVQQHCFNERNVGARISSNLEV
jgi:hypothetical protein